MSVLKKLALLGMIWTLGFSNISFADETLDVSEDVMEISTNNDNMENLTSNEISNIWVSDVNSIDMSNFDYSWSSEMSSYSRMMQIVAVFMWGFFFLMILFIVIPTMIWMFIISRKMGYKHSWLAFIPVANIYTFFKIAGKKAWFVITYLLVLITYFVLSYFSDTSMIYTILFIISALFLTIMWIMLVHSISKRCGYWVGLTIWLVFLPWIFLIIAWVKYKWIVGQVSEVEMKEEVKEIENIETEENIAE